MFELEDLDLAVCDPLHRRHIQIPTIPSDLLLSATQNGNNEAMTFGDPFLAPAIVDDDDESSSLQFQVMCTGLSSVQNGGRGLRLLFSQWAIWRRAASFSNRSTDLPWSWCR
jgi:hypothetical protein